MYSATPRHDSLTAFSREVSSYTINMREVTLYDVGMRAVAALLRFQDSSIITWFPPYFQGTLHLVYESRVCYGPNK